MEQKDAATTNAGDSESNLIKILTVLDEISARVKRLGMDGDLLAVLQLIVENAAQVVTIYAGPDESAPNAAAAIWLYEATQQTFDPDLGAAAGELKDISIDDSPWLDELGRQAIQRLSRLLSYSEAPERSIHPVKPATGACSLVCYPLIAGDEVVGVLYVYRGDAGHFEEITLLALDNFANLAAMAIYYGRRLAKLKHTLEGKINELETLRRASRLINTRTNFQEALRGILEVGLDITAAQYGSFELYDQEKNQLTIAAVAGRADELGDVEPLTVDEHSVVGWVALHKAPLLIPDLGDPEWQSRYHPLAVDQPMRSELAVPLLGPGDEVAGVLNIESHRVNAFSRRDQHLLELLATEAVIALQEFRLLEAMQEIAKAALRTEEDDLLKLIIERACTLINAQVGSIWTLAGDDALILRQSTAGYQWPQQIPVAESLTGQALRRRGPVTIDDVQTYPRFYNRELALQQKWVSGIVVPLLTPGEPGQALGGFSLYTSRRRDFSDLDRKLLTYLANQAAIAIQNAEEVAELKRAPNLSKRENQVLSLLIAGLTNKEIADELFVSVNTIKKHVQSIFTKLNVDSRAAAVAKVLGSDGWNR